MEHLVNFEPQWCCQDDFYDFEWGCGWRSLQTILTQLGIKKDIWTIAFEVKDFTQDEELLIDYDNQIISMADMSLTVSYFVDQAKSIGMAEPNADFDLLMISNLDQIQQLTEKLNNHFNIKKSKTLVMIATGGNIGLVAGYKYDEAVGDNMIFLFDPHSKRNRVTIGVGGIGWVSLIDTILNGQKQMNKSANDFLEINPATFAFMNGIVTLADLEDNITVEPPSSYSTTEIDKDIDNMEPNDILTFIKSENLDTAVNKLPKYQWLNKINETYFNELKLKLAVKIKQKFSKSKTQSHTTTTHLDPKTTNGKNASEELFHNIMKQYGNKLNDKEITFFNNLITEFNPDDENPETTKKEKHEFWSLMDDKTYRDAVTQHYQSIAQTMIKQKETNTPINID